LFFHAGDSVGAGLRNGNELWKSDGTEGGTMMVRNIGPGISDGFPMELTEMDNRLVFIANDVASGPQANYEPWISDGTEGGTQMIAETYPGLNPINWIPRNFEEIGDTVFFAAHNPFNGKELWQTDGTEAGTRMVRDIWPGGGGSYPAWTINADGVLFFRANDGIHGEEIWVLRDDSRCKMLSLGHTGQGADPIPDPLNSPDCDPGFFEAGEYIGLTANPDPGWTIAGWNGTDDDVSSSETNSLTMPDTNHSVKVNYQAPDQIFIHGFEPGEG
jgi:ELWxxDGT repeat protein